MIIIRFFGWLLVASLILPPLMWVAAMVLEMPRSDTAQQTTIPMVVSLLLGAILAHFLRASASKAKANKVAAKTLVEQRTADNAKLLQQLAAGELVPMNPIRVILKTSEKAYASVSAKLHEIQTVGFSAGTSGVSVRIAKGVTVRSSGTRGRAIKGDVIVASGELVVTDQRIVFAGDKKSLNIRLDDLLQVTPYNDGFSFADSRSTYTFSTPDHQSVEIFRITLDKVLGRS